MAVALGSAIASAQSRVATDADGDGLRDRWEASFGVESRSAAGDDGTTGDPDRDGRTNAQEQEAGTHPRGFFTRYLAESSTGQSFRTRIAIANPGVRPATLLLTFSASDRPPVRRTLVVGPLSRATVEPLQTPNLTAAEFNTIIESDEEVIVDRSTSKDGVAYASHGEASAPGPSRTWFMAEGATHSGLNLFYVIHNPAPTAADVSVRYLLPAPRQAPSRTYRVAAGRRFTIWVNAEAAANPALAGLAANDVSAAITSTIPVFVERAMYRDHGGQSLAVGHGSPGMTSAAARWLFAEGATGPFFDTSLTLMNPGSGAADVEAAYRLPSGETLTRHHVVLPGTRLSIDVDREDRRLADTTVSASLRSINGVEFVAERSIRWPGPKGAGQELHQSAGAMAPATRWGIAEGESGGAAHMDTLVTLTNTSPHPGLAIVKLLFEDGTTAAKSARLLPGSHSRLSLGHEFPSASGRKFGVLIESVGDPAAELVVEWAMHSAAHGIEWIPAINALATPLSTSTANTNAPVYERGTTPLTVASASSTAHTLATPAAEETTDAPPTSPAVSSPGAATFNVQVATDASPDLTDLNRFVGSMTSRWPTSREKVWALFYWSHILKRQTSPVLAHGFEVTDPIRNFADFGYTMCSTVSGINQALYHAIGLEHQYWDICNHTVSAVQYDGKFHMIDSSMSNLVTNDDGVTLATVQEAAAESARLVRERSLYSTSPGGFLTGTDAMRNLGDITNPTDGSILGGFAANFCSSGLKHRDYYYNWETGHRYVLNLREDESYTRHYAPLGTTADYWVPSEKIASPNPAQTFEIDSANRFGMRGNGRWIFTPKLTPDAWARAAYHSINIIPIDGAGLRPDVAGQTSEVIYKVQAANVITSQTIAAQFAHTDPAAAATLSVSVNHGATWADVATLGATLGSAIPLTASLRTQVSGAYETLIRIRMLTDAATPDGVVLTGLTVQTVTQVNIKALPRLNVGRNEVFVTLGDQSDTMVLWPELRANFWTKDAYDSQNIATQPVAVPRKYTAVAYPSVLTQDAYLTYRMDAPTDITRAVYGGRLHNYKPGSYIDFLHSFDGGATWIRSYRLSDVNKPYDVMHFETVTGIPPGTRSVLFKYLIHNTNGDATRASGLYSARMEVNHAPPNPTPSAIDITLRWKELRSDRTTIARSHRQRVTEFPASYVVNVAGSDHPVMESMTLSLESAADPTPLGYGDGTDPGGQKYRYTKQTVGTNFAKGKPYSFSRAPSGFQASAPATNTTILTDGVVGAPATGSFSYWVGQCWTTGQNVDLRMDLGVFRTTGAFRAHLFGNPTWDALKGQVQDRVEVLTSLDAVTFVSQGLLQTSLWRKNIPINYMLPDDEKATAWNFELALPTPVVARYVTFRMTPKRNLCATELQVLDRIDYEPFDIRIAPPAPFSPPPIDPPPNVGPSVDLTSPASGASFVAPATIVVTADAADTDGTVQSVEFFAGSTSIGSAAASPFTATWAGVPAGQYLLTARVTDDKGATATTGPVVVTVQPAAPNLPPSVSLTSPAGGAVFTSPVTITLTADATDPDDPVAHVEFFAGAESLGTASAAPYTVTWADVVPAQYSLTAVATDARGSQTTSAAVAIAVGNAGEIVVPAVVGLTQSAATTSIVGAGLTVGTVVSAHSATVSAGSVMAQNPVAGVTAAPESAVDLIVSLGPASVSVPNVVGQPQSTASSTIGAAGLIVGAVTTTTSVTVPNGSVISQSPVAGTSVAQGTTVSLVISLGPPGGLDPGLPSPWLTQDVGAVGVSGSATLAAATGTFSVTGGGADIWGTVDAFRFAYQPLTGDGQIIAHVASVQNTNAWVKAGVMMRGGVTSGAAHAMMMVTPGKGNNFQRRPVSGGASSGTAGSLVAPPQWVKLTRSGNTITAFESVDGTTWRTVGTATISLPATAFVGLAVSSHSTTTRATATFDQVSVGPPPPTAGDVPVPDVVGRTQAEATAAITGATLTLGAVTTAVSATVTAGVVLSQSPAAASTVAPGTAVSIVVSSGPTGGSGQPVPLPWLTQDVGTVGVTGNTAFYPATNSYAVAGAGADIWGTADAFRFVYQPLAGDGQIVARVAFVQNTNAWVKAGVMIRADLTPGSPHAMMMVTPGKNNNFQRRPAANGVSAGTTGAVTKAPYWVKLTRSGTTVTAYESVDNITWVTVGTATIALPADVLVGLAVSSHSTTSVSTATFEQVAVDHP